jgi:hypothetical protein
MIINWNGPATISGEVAALGTFHGPDGASSSWFSRRTLALVEGQNARLDITLAPVQATRRLVAGIRLPQGSRIIEKSVFYRFPNSGAALTVPAAQSGTYDEFVPDLRSEGPELCIAAVATPGTLLTQRCGVTFDSPDQMLTLEAMPVFMLPGGPTVSADNPLTWTSFQSGIYLLGLSPVDSPAPRVDFYTLDHTATWTDFAPFGISIPANSHLQAQIIGLGPFASMDDALGPEGVGNAFPSEFRFSSSPEIELTIAP